jgi:uncharacterized protein (DUF2252 family)
MRYDIKLSTPIPPEFSVKYLVAAGAVSSIDAGTPAVSVLASGTASGVVAAAQDGAGVISATAANDSRFAGIAKSDSTDVVATAGEVYCWMPLPGVVYSAKVKTSSTADTQAEVDALVSKQVVFDLTSDVWTVDAGATDAAANALVIVGGDYQTASVNFIVKNNWTVYGSVTTLS